LVLPTEWEVVVSWGDGSGSRRWLSCCKMIMTERLKRHQQQQHFILQKSSHPHHHRLRHWWLVHVRHKSTPRLTMTTTTTMTNVTTTTATTTSTASATLVRQRRPFLSYALLAIALWTIVVQYKSIQHLIQTIAIRRRWNSPSSVTSTTTPMTAGGNNNNKIAGINEQDYQEEEVYINCPQLAKNLCFVSSIFAPSVTSADQPSDVRAALSRMGGRHCGVHFYLFTNLPTLEAPGWFKLVSPYHPPKDNDTDKLNHSRSADSSSFSSSSSTSSLLQQHPYRRYITQSRWGKFMAWQDPIIQSKCQTVFYMDGYVQPSASRGRFQQLSQALRKSSYGLAQVLHPTFDGQSLEEIFDGILERRKDNANNTNITLKWLRAQPDMTPTTHLRYYLNKYFGTYECVWVCGSLEPSLSSFVCVHTASCFFEHDSLVPGGKLGLSAVWNVRCALVMVTHPVDCLADSLYIFRVCLSLLCSFCFVGSNIAYDPSNPNFQQLSSFFWKHYANETGSWRDQPMWAYSLYHFNITPLILTSNGNIERGGDLFQHGGTMGWGGHVYN
jgi:hypothetical protein